MESQTGLPDLLRVGTEFADQAQKTDRQGEA